MGLIDRTQPLAETGDALCASPPAAAGLHAARTPPLQAVVALAARLSGDCPSMLVPGLLVRLAEAADTDPADAPAAAIAARALAGYLAEHAIPLHALSESELVLGDDTARARLAAINADMARLEALVAGLEAAARPAGAALAAIRGPVWRPLGLGEARVRRGVLSSARLRGRLSA